MRILMVSLIAFSATTLGALAQEPFGEQAITPYTHAPSGMVFPASVEDFSRVRVSADEDRISADYLHADRHVSIRVILYPSDPIAADETDDLQFAQMLSCFRQSRQAEAQIAEGRRLLTRTESRVIQNGEEWSGHLALYTTAPTGPDERYRERVQTELHTYCYVGGAWTIEYRFDYPVTYNAFPIIDSFMGSLRWTISNADNAGVRR